jgi:preprotein translocase subunit SecD
MDRSWYLRFGAVVAAVIAAVAFLWPSIDPWFSAPPFLRSAIPNRIAAGLDIQGGMRLMYTVDVPRAIEDMQESRVRELRGFLGERMRNEDDEPLIPEGETPTREQLAAVRERVERLVLRDGENGPIIPERFILRFQRPADAEELLTSNLADYGLEELGRTENEVTIGFTPESLERLRSEALEQARYVIGNRIDALGLREASVRPQGDTDIIVEVPGANEEDFQRIQDIISQTARLEFQIVDDESDFIAGLADELPEGLGMEQETVRAGENRPAVLSSFVTAVGSAACPEGLEADDDRDPDDPQCTARSRLLHFIEQLERSDRVPEGHRIAFSRFDPRDEEAAAVAVDDRDAGWRTYYLFDASDVTGDNLADASVGVHPQTQQPIVNFSMKPSGARLMDELTGANIQRRMAVVLDDEVVTAPNIESRIGARGMITLGGYRDYNSLLNEANDIVVVLRAGSLLAPLVPQNQQLIGPTLGRDSVQRGALGALIGVILVLIFMAFYYEVAGVVADGMVLLNLLFLLAIMAAFGGTLTLPGVAGIALTIGMAVDANVLITERIREELRMGKSARAAVDQGFSRAFWSIFDSQLTTFIAGVVLFQYGSGPIRGFATTLMIGIVTSLFTGVFCSRVFFDWIVRGLRVKRLRVG